MATTRTDRNQVWDGRGNLLSEEVIQVDVTAEVIERRARAALAVNASFLQTSPLPASPTNAQVVAKVKQIDDYLRLVARQLNGVIRLELRDFSSDADT